MERISKLYEKSQGDKNSVCGYGVNQIHRCEISHHENIDTFLQLIEKFHEDTLKFPTGLFKDNQYMHLKI